MARNINSILQDLSSGLADLKNALQPITAMLGAFGGSAERPPIAGRDRGPRPTDGTNPTTRSNP